VAGSAGGQGPCLRPVNFDADTVARWLRAAAEGGPAAPVAKDHGVAAASVALAWLRQQPYVVAPLASATTADQLDELIASSAVELRAAEIDRLTAASESLG
jgi:aryl-alcohol dehydrogenase-like predicted oxidoreductase